MLGVPVGKPSTNPIKWKTFSNHWHCYNKCHATTDTNIIQLDAVFANYSEDDEIYPLTTAKIADAQKADALLKHLFKRNAVIDKGLEVKLIENTLCVCKDSWLIIPKPLQQHSVMRYHHYLQHPGHTCLKETMNAAMYWNDMHTSIQSITRSCKTCQINKRWSMKYGHLSPKSIISNPWECLCVNLIGPCTLKGRDNSQIDFMALTMIDPATSWFKIAELPFNQMITDIQHQWQGAANN